MNAKLTSAVEVYRRLVSHPDPVVAWFSYNGIQNQMSINSIWNQSDLDRLEKVKFTKSYLVSESSPGKFEVNHRKISSTDSNIMYNEEAPSGKFNAIIRKFTPKKGGEEKQFIEIWNHCKKIKQYDVLGKEKHGKICTKDGQFGCLYWSKDETKLLYVLERKTPKMASFFDTKKVDKPEEEQPIRGHEHDFKQDWGEQLVGKHKLALNILDLNSGEINTLDTIPENLSVGQFINDAERSNADANGLEMTVEKQDIHRNYNGSGHGTKILKSTLSLAPSFLPCAAGTDHGNGQPEHQDHSEIYQSTLEFVSNCPSPGEYMQKSLAKCVDVCGSYMQDGNCAYHCMRDSSKTKLVEFCAKPEILFDYCPEYDPVDQTIQKDTATLCNSTFSRNYYNSSDIYFCDPENCLQLYDSSVRSATKTLTTLMNETTEMNGGDSQEWYIPLLIGAAALIVAILLGRILWVFYKRGRFSGNPSRTRNMAKKRNRNGLLHSREKILVEI